MRAALDDDLAEPARARGSSRGKKKARRRQADAKRSEGFREAPTGSVRVRRPRLESAPGLREADLSDFRLLKPIGLGGMGTVYLATRVGDPRRRPLALKIMNPGGAAERFLDEQRILSRLLHPNIVRLFEHGRTRDGRPYLVMEYVDGVPIDRYCDARRSTVEERLAFFHAVCSAVHHIHDSRVVHRDLKPANILVTESGVPKLLDFGIAKPIDRAAFPRFTDTREMKLRMMTPAYASPEQVAGRRTTAASDVYSLGALLYKLLTGRPPHQSLEQRLYQLEILQLEEPPLKPSVAVASLAESGDLRDQCTLLRVSSRRSTTPWKLRRMLAGDPDSIVRKALCQDPAGRYASAAALAADVERHLGGLPVEARKGTLGYQVARLMSRSRQALTVCGRFRGAAEP